jgi:predicted DNA-binding transcriptional regulator AlpA
MRLAEPKNGPCVVGAKEMSHSTIEPEQILTPEQLAERLQVAVSWVYEKSRARGKHGSPLPVLRCGRYLRFSWPDVCAWMRAGSVPKSQS